VIRPTENSNDLVLFVLNFGDPKVRVLLLEVVRVDEDGLVSQELFARGKVFREQPFRLRLDNLFILVRNGIPKF
jgi:hypothetical protein